PREVAARARIAAPALQDEVPGEQEEPVDGEIAGAERVEQPIERLVDPPAVDQLEAVREEHRAREPEAPQIEVVGGGRAGGRRGLARGGGGRSHRRMVSLACIRGAPEVMAV